MACQDYSDLDEIIDDIPRTVAYGPLCVLRSGVKLSVVQIASHVWYPGCAIVKCVALNNENRLIDNEQRIYFVYPHHVQLWRRIRSDSTGRIVAGHATQAERVRKWLQ